MKKVTSLSLGYLLIALLFPIPIFATAPGCTTSLTDPNTNKTFTDVPSLGCLADTIVNIINAAFLLVGAVTIIFLLFGAIKFIVARGDPKAIKSAQGTITYAIAGAILILLSFVIINLITNTLGLPPILQNFTLYQQ